MGKSVNAILVLTAIRGQSITIPHQNVLLIATGIHETVVDVCSQPTN